MATVAAAVVTVATAMAAIALYAGGQTPTTQSSPFNFMVNHRKQAGMAAMCKGFYERQQAHQAPCVHGPCYG